MGRSVPVMVTVLTFVVHFWRGEPLDVAAAFTVLALFNAARFPLSVLAIATRFTAEAYQGMRRLQRFLGAEEAEDPKLYHQPGNPARAGEEPGGREFEPRRRHGARTAFIAQWQSTCLAPSCSGACRR